MTCKCGQTGVYNEAGGKGFYYCRNCKVEIQLEEVKKSPTKHLTQEEIDELFRYIPGSALDDNPDLLKYVDVKY